MGFSPFKLIPKQENYALIFLAPLALLGGFALSQITWAIARLALLALALPPPDHAHAAGVTDTISGWFWTADQRGQRLYDAHHYKDAAATFAVLNGRGLRLGLGSNYDDRLFAVVAGRPELAPLAGHYPVLKLGPSWWFHDSPEGMMRFREQVTETAGFYNTVGFNDDTRAFLSIPARHDVARRVDSAFLARMVAEHRMDLCEAEALIVDLTYNLPKKAYKLDQRPAWARPVQPLKHAAE